MIPPAAATNAKSTVSAPSAAQDGWVERVLRLDLEVEQALFAHFDSSDLAGLEIAAGLDAPAPISQTESEAASFAFAQGYWDGVLIKARAACAAVAGPLRDLSPPHADGLAQVTESYWGDLARAFPAKGAIKDEASAETARAALLTIIYGLRSEMAGDVMLAAASGLGSPVDKCFANGLDEVERLIGSPQGSA